MTIYAFWNNKGGTGKTSIAFQTIAEYAFKNPKEKILAVDLCPQANLSDLFLGGLINEGGRKLEILQEEVPRRTIGGYFQSRIQSPYTPPTIETELYLSKPYQHNDNIPENIDLLAGDQLVEVQTNAMASLSNQTLPGVTPWLGVIDWLNDFIEVTEDQYDKVFIDTNPSFSIYTQIAIATADKLILPVMADDSSRRAVKNVFSLVHDVQAPSIYTDASFSNQLIQSGRDLPKVHLILKNRLTQYMGPASAYQSVFTAIDEYLEELLASNPEIFTNANFMKENIVNIRDFQTTGVIAFAYGLPFRKAKSGVYSIYGTDSQISRGILKDSLNTIEDVIKLL